jgi:hypothetical protein
MRSQLLKTPEPDGSRVVRVWREPEGLMVKAPGWRKARGPFPDMPKATNEAASAIGHGFTIAFGRPRA